MSTGLSFRGRPDHQRRSFFLLWGATWKVTPAPARPPARPFVVVDVRDGHRAPARADAVMFTMPPEEARVRRQPRLPAPVLDRVRMGERVTSPGPGRWFEPREQSGRTLLYLHGGGYAFHGSAYESFVAIVAEATGAHVRARLPARARASASGAARGRARGVSRAARLRREAVAARGRGRFGGGHLTLSLVIALRDAGDPLPAVAMGCARGRTPARAAPASPRTTRTTGCRARTPSSSASGIATASRRTIRASRRCARTCAGCRRSSSRPGAGNPSRPDRRVRACGESPGGRVASCGGHESRLRGVRAGRARSA